MKKVIKNVHVFDGNTVSTELAHVVINNGYIQSVGAMAPAMCEEYNARGLTLLPGFIDTHIHIDSCDNCALAVKSGITTFIDQMCDKPELIDSLDEPGEPITTVRSVYLPIQAQPGKMFIDAIGYEPPYVKTKDDVRRTIDTEIAKGAVVIKMLLDLPPITTGMLAEELIEETVRYAHEKGKLVSAHTTSVEAYRLAAKYGVDILNHTPKDEPVPMDIINEIKQKDLTVIPTTVMQEGIVRNMQKVMPECAGNFENVLETVRRLHEAGVRMLVGTDSNRTNKMCFITHGESIFREFDFLHDAGLTNLDILHGATSTAADIFGLSDRGSIEVGKRADLVLVEGDPTKDISACRNIKKVWVKGVEAIL